MTSCKKANSCVVKTWYIDVTDHPLVNGLCVDNNTPLQITLNVSKSITVPCPTQSTSSSQVQIYNGSVNTSPTGPPILQTGGNTAVGSTVSATFTLKANCCCNNKGVTTSCAPLKGAKNVWELKTTLVTQKPLINTFGAVMQSADWQLVSINCCL